MPSKTFDEELAQILGRIDASSAGVEHWVDPVAGIQPRTPEEEQEKTGMLAALGSILHEPKRRVDIAMNYYAGGPLRDRVLSGQEPVPTGQLAKEAYIAPPEPGQDPLEQHARAAGRGIMERWIDISTDPTMFVIPPVMKAAPAAVATVAGLGFTAAMAKDAIHQADRTYQSYKREGWSPTTSEEAAKTAFDVGMIGTMLPGFIPKRGGAPRPVTPEEPGSALMRPGEPPEMPPGLRGGDTFNDLIDDIGVDFYRNPTRTAAERLAQLQQDPRYQAMNPAQKTRLEDAILQYQGRKYKARREAGEEPEEGAPPEGPPPPPPPTVPGPATIREVNVPDAPERMADDALLAQLDAIKQAQHSALAGGNVDRAQELQRHHDRLRDVYRARRYAPGVQVGRAGDLMQLRDQLNAELERGASLDRQLQIRESLSVLDAEIELARAATQIQPPGAPPGPPPEAAPPEAIPPAPEGGLPPPEAAAPEVAGPIPSRAPQVTPGAPGERGPGLEPTTPVQAAQEGVAAARQPTQELLEQARATISGQPAPASMPLATVLEGGEAAGAGTRLAEPPAAPSVITPEVLPGPSALGPPAPWLPPRPPRIAGEPGGPPLDVAAGTPGGPPRLGPVHAVAPKPQEKEPEKKPVTPQVEPTWKAALPSFVGAPHAKKGEEPAEPPAAAPAEKPAEAPAAVEEKPAEKARPVLEREPEPDLRERGGAAEIVRRRRALSRDELVEEIKRERNEAADEYLKTAELPSEFTAEAIRNPTTGTAEQQADYEISHPVPDIAHYGVGDRVRLKSGAEGVVTEIRSIGGKGVAVQTEDYRGRKRTEVVANWNLTPIEEGAPEEPPPAEEEPTGPPFQQQRARALELATEAADKAAAATTDKERELQMSMAEDNLARAARMGEPPEQMAPIRATLAGVRQALGRLPEPPGGVAWLSDAEERQAAAAGATTTDAVEAAIRAAPAPAAAPAAPTVEDLETEQRQLKEQRAQQLADENARLRDELEAQGEAESAGLGPVPPEILPRGGGEVEGGGEVGGAPAEAGGNVPEGLPAVPGVGPLGRPGEGGGEGRGVPEAGEAELPVSPRSVTTDTPVGGTPIEELRADGEKHVVEPSPEPAPEKKRPAKGFAWDEGDLEKSEQRSLKQKVDDNLAALSLLKAIEAEDRPATPEEATTLASYIGWGGMPRAFKEYDYGQDVDFWQQKHKALKALLTPEEYETAKASTTNAHYTREQVIRTMWDAVEAWGGTRMMRVLEPSMGVGNFLSAMQPAMKPAHVTGVELDPITGRIAKRLFPGSAIHVGGFESTPIADNYFDLAISNVPFGPYSVADPKYRRNPIVTKRIHNYFFAKALDKVRPGGVVAFITSHGTLDAKDSAIRDYLAERAWFVGAVRMPQETFQRNAHTSVTADVVILQKKVEGQARPAWAAPDSWTETAELSGYKGSYGQDVAPRLSQYFKDNPAQLLGNLKVGDGTAGPDELTLGGTFDPAKLKEALARLGAPDLLKPPEEPKAPPPIATIEELRKLKTGNLTVREGKVWRLERDGTFAEPDIPKTAEAVAKSWIPVREATREVIGVQLERGTDAQVAKAQKDLNKAYDAFVAKHGPLHEKAARALEDDPDFPLTLAIEEYKPAQYKTGGKGQPKVLVKPAKASKRDIFTKRTVSGYEPPEKAASPLIAYGVSLAEKGHVDVERVAGLLGKTPGDALADIINEGLAYEDPVNGGNLVSAEEYLSGLVVDKLEQAQAAAEQEPERFAKNVAALQAVQPTPLAPSEVIVQLGASWVPASDYEAFAAMELGGSSRPGGVSVKHAEGLGSYFIEWNPNLSYTAAAISTYGTEDKNAFDLFEQGMNLKSPTVYRGSGSDRYLDEAATALARDKLDKIKERFGTWIFEDADRAERLVALYNRQMNNVRLREPDGAHLALPGINRSILRGGDFMPHQKNDVWRILTQPNTLVAEPVGSGKTFTLAAAAMEARRMGLVKKPLLAVLNSTFESWREAFQKLYPHARVMAVQPGELTGAKRAETMSRIATQEWDTVLVTHEALQSLPVSAPAFERVVREQISMLDQTIREVADIDPDEDLEDVIQAATAKKRGRGRSAGGLSRSDTKLIKQIEKQKAALKAKLQKMYEDVKRDNTIAFDELGVDMLMVDESQQFNNLHFPTKLGRVKGISNEDAGRAFDLYVKTQTLQHMTGGRGVVFATATPVRNTLAEMYTLFRYLDPEFLKARGLRHFDDWVRAFAQARQTLELKPSGAGYRPETRFASFVNVPELLTAFRNMAAVMTAEDLKLPVPELVPNSEGERKPNFIAIPPSDEVRDFVKQLDARANALKGKGSAKKGEDNMLVVTGDGRKAAIDLALVGRAAEPKAGQKLDVTRQAVFDEYKRTTPTRGVQAVFLDLSTPDSAPFSAYRWLRDQWIAMGVPAEEIAFAHDYPQKKRQVLYDKLNASEIRIVMGSTKKIGVGANFQENLVALWNVDVPWTPDGYEQRNGRIVRQGNLNPEVKINNLVTKGTFDAYMWQTLSNKAGFIGQVMTGKATARSMEDVSLTYLTAQEALAATSENPLVVKKIKLDADLRKLERLAGGHQLEVYNLGKRKADWERQVTWHRGKAAQVRADVAQLPEGKVLELFEKPGQKPDAPAKTTHEKRTEEAGKELQELIEGILPGPGSYYIGRYRGFPILVARKAYSKDVINTDVYLPSPHALEVLDRNQLPTAVAIGTINWKPTYHGSGQGLLASMDSNVPSEENAKHHDTEALKKEHELGKLKVPEFRQAAELEQVKRDLEVVKGELALEKDDAAAAGLEDDPDDGGDGDPDADYEGGETGVRDPDDEPPQQTPPAAPGGGAGGAGEGPGGPRKPPPDDGDSTPDGLPSDGPQPGEEGWARRVREAKARNQKRARGGQANAGVDPMHMADIAIEGADLVSRGFRRFAAWSNAMLRSLGNLIPGLRGMLRGLWNWIREMFGKSGRGPTAEQTRRAARPGFEEYRTQYEAATGQQKGAGRKRYPFEEAEIPPEETARAAEAGARVGEEPTPKYGKPPRADVNFDRIGGEPDIREWQARVVESLKPRWGKIRNFRSWDEARVEAVKAGLTEHDFIRLVKERGVVTDIEIEAGRMMRQQGAESAFAKLNRMKDLREQRRTETDPTKQRALDQELLEADREYRDALARYVAVTSATVEAASELGRALNIHRRMAEAITPEEAFFRNLLRKHPGMSEKMQQDLADAVMNKDAARIRELARQLYKPGVFDYASEWFINSLLSGVSTLAVNTLGNLAWESLYRTPERAVGAALEAGGVRQWVERFFGREAGKRERFGREAEEALRKHIQTNFGMMRALKYAWQYLGNEAPIEGVRGESYERAFPGLIGKVIRTPSRMMFALDQGSRWAAMEAEMSVQAVRRAITEARDAGGWTREQVSKRMSELQEGFRRWQELEGRRKGGEVLSREEYQHLSKNPMYGRWEAAMKAAGEKATFTDAADRFSGALIQMREAHPWLKFFIPFIKTPSRILAAALERSPIGAYQTFKRAKSGELAGGELTDAMARVVYGNMVGASLYLLARQGFISGSGPADPRERALKMKTGWQPYSVKVGDKWVSMARLEPFGTHLGWAADLAETADARGAGSLYDKLIQGVTQNLVEKTYLQGVVGVAEAVSDPERYGAGLARKTVGAFVPNLLAQAARGIDPTVRETDTIANTLLSRVPIASTYLPARRSGTGEIVRREEHPLSLAFSPFRYATEKGPEANLERTFLDVGYIPSNAPKTLTVPGTGGQKVALNQGERDLYGQYAERATRVARRLAQSPDFQQLEADQKEELLKRIYRYAHDAAHQAMTASVLRRARTAERVK